MAKSEEISDDLTLFARRKRALAFCDKHIQRYQWLKWRSGKGYYYLSIITILLSASIPVILLTSNNAFDNYIIKIISQYSSLISAIFSAIIAISTGILTLYQWRENYPRYSYTLQRLVNEKAKFEALNLQEGPDGGKKINNFLKIVDEILIGEVIEWRSIMSKIKEDPPGKNKTQGDESSHP